MFRRPTDEQLAMKHHVRRIAQEGDAERLAAARRLKAEVDAEAKRR